MATSVEIIPSSINALAAAIAVGGIGTSVDYDPPLTKTLVAATAQTILAASSTRKLVWLESTDSANIFYRLDGVAASGAPEDHVLLPGGNFINRLTPTEAVSAYSVLGGTMRVQTAS